MLAKILSQKHGFDCVVLFAINPDGGYIDPNFQKNIPGTAALDSADLMIIGTRFRQLPDDQIAKFAAYLMRASRSSASAPPPTPSPAVRRPATSSGRISG